MKLIEVLKFTHLLNEQLNAPSNYTSLSSEIYEMADTIYRFMIQKNNGKLVRTFHYSLRNGVANAAFPLTSDIEGWEYNGQNFKYCPKGTDPLSSKYYICCASYVWWILGECGLCNGETKNVVKAADLTPSIIQRSLKSNYKAISIGRNIKEAQKGDILVFGLNGDSHTSIFSSFDGTNIYEYGMGDEIYSVGTVKSPHKGRTTKNLKDIIRIVIP